MVISIPYLFKESSHLRLLSCLCLNKYLCTSCLYLLFYLYQPGFYIENRVDWFTVPVWIFPNMMPASSQTSNNIRPAPAGFMYILHFHNDGICHPHLQNYARYRICRKNSLSHPVIIRISSCSIFFASLSSEDVSFRNHLTPRNHQVAPVLNPYPTIFPVLPIRLQYTLQYMS